MKRICVIDVAGMSLRLLRSAEGLWVHSLHSPPRAMRATFPALRASVQASMTTGAEPGAHGIIAGGVYRRESHEVSLYECSNTLLSRKRFWHAGRMGGRPKVAMLFWSNPLAGAADVVVGASNYCLTDREPVAVPQGLCASLRGKLGTFDSPGLRGPKASWRVCRWIVAAAEEVWREHRPDLQFVYLPGVNFEMVRHGPDSPQAMEALRQVDALAKRLADAVAADGGRTVVLSDGGHVPVRRAGCPNVLLRRAGLLKVRASGAGEQADLENSLAFALVDHQVAHLFCGDESAADEAARAVVGDPAVAAVVPRDRLFDEGLGRDRAGERILLAAPDAWFCYRWWEDDAAAPAIAFKAETPGKLGYDPCELLPGPAGGDIGFDPALVRTSRGLADTPVEDQPVVAATCDLPLDEFPAVTDVAGMLERLMLQRA